MCRKAGCHATTTTTRTETSFPTIPAPPASLRLARWLPDRAQRYRDVARETLKVLLADFLTPGGVVLHGSWGRMRHVEAGKPRLGRFPQEDVMPYGNYWIAECLYRELSTDWSILSLDGKA
jgi:unsaturated chondroitin disaccharide hydrolase